jgi:hypothetical protein
MVDQIVIAFPFFPQLHTLLATHPNLNPVAISTGIGPNGHELQNFRGSVDHQSRISDDMIDPALCVLDSNSVIPPTASPVTSPPMASPPIACAVVSFATAQENMLPIPRSTTPARGPKQSTFGSERLDAAVAKANTTISRIPKKQTLEDSFLSVQVCAWSFFSSLTI